MKKIDQTEFTIMWNNLKTTPQINHSHENGIGRLKYLIDTMQTYLK